MPDLDPAHVAAIAAPLLGRTATSGARQILTSPDPDVHAALLAALVRAGVLGEQVDGICDDVEQVVVRQERRYVTRWEDA